MSHCPVCYETRFGCGTCGGHANPFHPILPFWDPSREEQEEEDDRLTEEDLVVLDALTPEKEGDYDPDVL